MTLISVMLVSAFAAGSLVTVQADPAFPWEPLHLWAVVDSYPYNGFAGGYHALLDAIKLELAKIGITLHVQTYDSVWDICWDTHWDVPGNAPGSDPATYTLGVDGWDFTTAEWSNAPPGLLWVDEFVYKTPAEAGYNLMPNMNPDALDLYDAGTQTLDLTVAKDNLWDWQELFMDDPPMINLYYGMMYEVTGVYVEGWDPTVWFYDTSHFGINETAFELYAPPDRYAKGSNTLFYGVDEPIWGWNPLFTLTYTEEMARALTHDNLYTTTRLWNDTTHEFYGVLPNGFREFVVRPEIAATPIEWRTGPNGPNTVARITMRHDDWDGVTPLVDENIYWSDGEILNASDVKFTYDWVIDQSLGSYSFADFGHIIDHVEIIDEFTVDFHLYAPRWDFESLLTDDWGVQILPWHQMKDLSAPELKGAPHTDPMYLVCSGPYKIKSYESGVKLEFERNPLYFGYELGWGPYVDNYVLLWYTDAAARKTALETLVVDYAEYPVADVDYWENTMKPKDTHKVWTYLYHGSNPLYINFDNPILSSRYVRMAIAYAIPYHLFDGLLDLWGIPESFPGIGTFITPLLGDIYNPDLEPYTYNLEWAEDYMWMWWYADEGHTPWQDGPVGDGDFSGHVTSKDVAIWISAIITGKLTNDTWIFDPGEDIDPDFTNDNDVRMADYFELYDKLGYYYPEGDKFLDWSRVVD